MIKAFGISVLFCLAFGVAGASVGLFTAEHRLFEHSYYGKSPIHHCVVEQGNRCGLYQDESARYFETSRRSREQVSKPAGVNSNGLITWQTKFVVPTYLTDTQLEAALASRDALRRKTEIGNAQDFAVGGALLGLAVAVVYLAVSFLISLSPKLENLGRKLGRSAGAVGGRVGNARNAITETARLRAEVRKAELLARKAAAEAKLKRQNPDADQFEVELRQHPHA